MKCSDGCIRQICVYTGTHVPRLLKYKNAVEYYVRICRICKALLIRPSSVIATCHLTCLGEI